MQAGLFSAVASAFIIDIQSELSPDYEQANNLLLEMLLNATTGTLPANFAASIPQWTGPDPVVVQVQCILYATLFATLLAAFLAMLGKQWLSRYKENETRGSAADRSRLRERKLTGIETWKFHLVMESLPLILQGALLLFGFALSRYLWGVNSSVSTIVITFTGFGFLFYSVIVTASVFSFNCPFQTPLSLFLRFVVKLATPHMRNLRKALGSTQQHPQPRTELTQINPPVSIITVDRGHDLRASITALASMTPNAIQLLPQPVTPLFAQEKDFEGDRLDARCINRLFEMSTDFDVIISNMDFIPEIVWHSGIKDVPRKRIYDILMDCFDFSGTNPVVLPKSRDVAYLSARAFVHIELQRRCITPYEEYKRDSWKALCANHHPLSPAPHRSDPDLQAVLFMVDMTLGHDNVFAWAESEMTPSHRAWTSHVLLYHTSHEEQVPEIVLDFVENSISIEPPSNTVIADCFFIIGLMIGVSFHTNDIPVKDKRLDLSFPSMFFANLSPSSCETESVIGSVFRAFEDIFFSDSIQVPSALHALRLATRVSCFGVCDASYRLFKIIMGLDNLTDQQWEAARFAVDAAFKDYRDMAYRGDPKEILKFLDYHVGLQGAKEDHGSFINSALRSLVLQYEEPDPLTYECVRDFNWTNLSFVRGVCSMMYPHRPGGFRGNVAPLLALLSDSWFTRSGSVMEQEEMSEFCDHFATYMDDIAHVQGVKKEGATILFALLRSPEWRIHIAARSWRVLAYCTQAMDTEPVRWCLQEAVELLEFAKGLPHGEGLRWWYGALWLCYDKLSTTVRDEVRKIATDMLRDDGLSDLNLYLGLMQEEITRLRQEMNELSDIEKRSPIGMDMQTLLITMGGNYDQLARITGRR